MTSHLSVWRIGLLLILLTTSLSSAIAGSLVSDPDLIAAAKSGNMGQAKNAVLRGDDADITDDDGLTPLLYAIKNDHPEITTLLVTQGHASPNRPGRDGKTPLWWAATLGDADTVDTLVKAGAKVDIGAKGGITPLMAAAAAGRDDAVVMLLADGAEVGRSDYSGRDALSWAEDSRDPHVIAILKAAQKH